MNIPLRINWSSFLVVLILVQVTACSNHQPHSPSISDQIIKAFKQMELDGCAHSKRLVSIAQAYRREKKRWPVTIEELMGFCFSHKSEFPVVAWEEYSNLRFEALTDGGLNATYDALVPLSFSPSQKMPVKMQYRIGPTEEPHCEPTNR